LAIFVDQNPDSLVFGGAKGSPLRRSNFNRMIGWAYAVEAIGSRGLPGQRSGGPRCSHVDHAPDLGLRGGAGEGNRTLMTSLEDFMPLSWRPRMDETWGCAVR
jgi:hypothetical protein